MKHLKKSESSNVNHPSHYQGKAEVIEIIEQLTEGMEGRKSFSLGNVVKYIFRHENKGGIEDLKKAAWYLDRAIEMEGENNGSRPSQSKYRNTTRTIFTR